MFNITPAVVKDAMNEVNEMMHNVFGSSYIRPNFTKITVTKAQGYWGKICYNRTTGEYKLRISNQIGNYDTWEHSRRKLISTLVHEFIHTMPGAFNHGLAFKRYGELFHRRYGDIEVTRVSGGGEGYISTYRKPTYKYIIVCEDCDCKYRFQRASFKTKFPELCRCGKCGGSHLHTVTL